MAAEPFDPDRHCGAHPDSLKGPCRAPKGRGTDHPGYGRCKHHGGNTPSGKTMGQREMAMEIVAKRRLIADATRRIDPAAAMLEEIARLAGMVDWLGDQVEAACGERPENLVAGTLKVRRVVDPEGGATTTTEVGPHVNVWYRLWKTERKDLFAAAAEATRVGLDARVVKLAEQNGNLIADAIRRILALLDLSPAQQARVPEVVPQVLRDVSRIA